MCGCRSFFWPISCTFFEAVTCTFGLDRSVRVPQGGEYSSYFQSQVVCLFFKSSRHSKSCCKTPIGSVWLWVLLDKYRAGLQLLLPQVCEICFVIYQEQKTRWENVISTIRVLSRLTALLTWAASLGWTSAVTCCNSYRESTHLYVLHYHTYIDFARPITQIVLLMKCNQIQFSYYMDGIFCSILFCCV